VNKQKFVDLLRQPETISTSSLSELEQLVVENPYFHCGHIVIAKASKHLKSEQTGKKVNTAAIYATSRKAFKNYIQGDIVFGKSTTVDIPKKLETKEISQTQSPKVEETTISSTPPPSSFESNVHLSHSEHDSLINEVYENIEEWRKSRNNFLEYELSIEESKSDVDKLKSQIAEEIIAEEEQVNKALKGIEKKGKKKKTSPKQSTSDESIEKVIANSEETDLNDDGLDIDQQKKNLKLTPGNKGGKKFRLNILRPSTKSKSDSTTKKTTTKKSTSKAVKAKATKDTSTKKPPAKSKSKTKTTTAKTKKTDLEEGKKKNLKKN